MFAEEKILQKDASITCWLPFPPAEMKNNILDSTSQEKLEVAARTCLTLSKNIQKLEEQMKNGSTVKQNEAFLDDIRTITILFSEIMQDFIMTEIRIANETNNSIKKSSIRLTILHFIFVKDIKIYVIWVLYMILKIYLN